MSPGPLTWSSTSVLPRGAVVRYSGGWNTGLAGGAALLLSMDGDQIFVYMGDIVEAPILLPSPWRGDPCSASLLFGINFANGGWDNVNGGTTTHSFIPCGLSSNEWTAVHVDRRPNGYYRGISAGTPAQLRQAIAQPVNWVTGNDRYDPTNWVGSLDVIRRGTVLSTR
jgi:hypothetical protein